MLDGDDLERKMVNNWLSGHGERRERIEGKG